MNLNDPSIKATVDDLVEREWQFFSTVNNQGGTASCQTMPRTFSAARRAQYAIWPKEAIESWRDDLITYGERGENPLTFKYAYMMSSTHPDEYERIRDLLPVVEPERQVIIEELVGISVTWAEEMAARYPHYARRGRPVHTSEDTAQATSQETYARAEFSTYSQQTLELLLAAYHDAQDQGENLTETSATELVRAHGYRSLSDADRAIVEGRMSHTSLDDTQGRTCAG